MLRCSGDDTFGPVLASNSSSSASCYDFDFTLLFEDAFLSLVPNGLFLFLAAWRVHRLVRECTATVVVWPLLRACKIALFAVQTALQLAVVILQATGHGVVARTTVAADAVAVASTLALLAVSWLEHSRTVRPAAVTQLFLFFSLLFDAPRIRTFWLLDGPSQHVVASLITAALAVKFVALQVESVPKWTHVVSVAPNSIAPEERQGVFSRIFFWWLMPLFLAGYRRDLAMDDLCAIDDDLQGRILHDRLQKQWERANHTKKHCLTAAVLRTFAPELGTALVPRLGFAAFSLAQPYLISAMLNYITHQATLPVSYGYGLIGAYAFVYTGMGVSAFIFTFCQHCLLSFDFL